MGTNYYAHVEYQVPEGPSLQFDFHVGKSSGGWQFLLQGYHPPKSRSAEDQVLKHLMGKAGVGSIQSWEDWKKILLLEEVTLKNEYKDTVPLADLEARVLWEGDLLKHPGAEDKSSYGVSYRSFF